MSDLVGDVQVDSASAGEIEAAFRLIFQGLEAVEREQRVANALDCVRRGELDPQGLTVARARERLCGAMLCMAAPGATGLVWPPHARGRESRQAEDGMVQRTRTWLKQQGTKLAQALLADGETKAGGALERNGFTHTTRLWYMRKDDLGTISELARPVMLRMENYGEACREVFHSTLLRSYEGTLDCPEINGVRTLEQIMDGHRAQGVYDPRRWWLAWSGDRPVGVLMMAAIPELASWDISYVGVVADERRRGFGRELVNKAILEAGAANVAQLTLSVDARNAPAWKLYRNLGFEPYDIRDAYLCIL